MIPCRVTGGADNSPPITLARSEYVQADGTLLVVRWEFDPCRVPAHIVRSLIARGRGGRKRTWLNRALTARLESGTGDSI